MVLGSSFISVSQTRRLPGLERGLDGFPRTPIAATPLRGPGALPEPPRGGSWCHGPGEMLAEFDPWQRTCQHPSTEADPVALAAAADVFRAGENVWLATDHRTASPRVNPSALSSRTTA